jgi:hypothetical protein
MRRLLFAVLLLLAVNLLISQFGSFEQFVNVLRNGQLIWILLAFVVQVGWLVNQTAAYRALYRVVGLHDRLRNLFPLVLASNTANIAAPTGGASGIAVFVDNARSRGLSTARVTLAGVLYIVFDYITFCFVLVLGLIVLSRRAELDAAEVVASAIMFGSAVVLGTLFLLGLRSAAALERVLVMCARTINGLLRPLLRRDYLSEQAAHFFAAETAEGLLTLRKRPPGQRLLPIALSLNNHAYQLTILFLIFLAFNQPLSPGVIIAVFSMAYLFTIVSPTPMGIGVVEGLMTLTLRSVNVPLEAASVIALAFRGFALWLPVLYGFLALQLSSLRRR